MKLQLGPWPLVPPSPRTPCGVPVLRVAIRPEALLSAARPLHGHLGSARRICCTGRLRNLLGRASGGSNGRARRRPELQPLIHRQARADFEPAEVQEKRAGARHSRRGGLWAQFGGPRANQQGMGARLRSGGRAIGRCLPMAQWTSPMARHLHCIPCRCDQPLLLPRWAARGQKTRAAKLVLAVYFVPDHHDQAGGGGRRAADPGSRSRL